MSTLYYYIPDDGARIMEMDGWAGSPSSLLLGRGGAVCVCVRETRMDVRACQ